LTTRIKPRLAAASTKIAGHRRVDANSTTCEAEPKTHPRPARPRAFTEKKPFRQRQMRRKACPNAVLLNAAESPALPSLVHFRPLPLTNGGRSGLARPAGAGGRAPWG